MKVTKDGNVYKVARITDIEQPKLQYVVTDTPDPSVYSLLAQKIVEAAWRDTIQMVSAASPS